MFDFDIAQYYIINIQKMTIRYKDIHSYYRIVSNVKKTINNI